MLAHASIPTSLLPPLSDGPLCVGLQLQFHSRGPVFSSALLLLLPHPGSLHYYFCHALWLGLCSQCHKSCLSVAHTYVNVLPRINLAVPVLCVELL